MKDEDKSKEHLINELTELRCRIVDFEKSEAERKPTEEALTKSEEKYRSLIEKSGAGVATADIKGKFSFVNKALCKMIGYTEEELIGKPFARFLHPDDKKRIMKIFWDSWKSPGKEMHLEFRVIHKKGHSVYCHSKPTAFIHKKKIAGFNAIITDITKLRQAEGRISESEEKFRNIFENAADGLAYLDKHGKILEVNQKAVEIYGGMKEELLGKHFKKSGVVFIKDIPLLMRNFKYVLSGKTPNIQMSIKNKKGEKKYLECSTTLAKKEGLLTGAIVIIRDITERKKTEEALKESEQRYRQLFEGIGDAVMVFSSEGKFLDCNEVTLKRLGYKREEFLHKKPADIVHPDFHQLMRDNQKRIWAGKATIVESAHIGKDGRVIPVEVDAHKIIYKGKSAILAVARDITDRKRAEEKIKASLMEKEILLQEIHHRVKNNMQVISSILNLQARDITDKQVLEIFKSSQNRVKSMALIHERLYQSKDFARIDFTKYVQSLTSHLFSSHGISPDIIKLKINIKGVSLNINTAIPCGIIINELISNSLKHAFPEGEKGEIKIAMHPLKGSEIELVVSDNGIGLPKKVDIRNTKSLGLRLVTLLAEDQLHGDIKIDRTNGTNYQIKLNVSK